MKPELRGVAFAIVLTFPIPIAYQSEGVTPIGSLADGLVRSVPAETEEPDESPLATHLDVDLRSAVGVIRTTSTKRVEVRSIKGVSP